MLYCVLICYVNRSDSFVQPAGYYSCQLMSDGSASFRRSDTSAILIGDITTTNPTSVLAEMKGWQGGQWFLGKCGVLVSRIVHVSFVSACYLCCFNFRKRSDQLFSGYEDNVVINACGETKSCFTLFLFECTHTHRCWRVNTRALSRSHARTLVLFLYFHWRRVPQKSTFNGKRLVFLRTRIHRGTRYSTSERTHTGNVRIGSCVEGPYLPGSCALRKCGFSQLVVT